MSDTLLDLHSKLATVVRYYDRMLEERLSNTYSQHTLGGYGPHPLRSSSNIYPSIPTNIANGQNGAESFYTGNPIPQSDSYARPQASYDTFSQPRSPYSVHDRGPSTNIPEYGAGPPLQAQRQQHVPYQQQKAPTHQSYPHSPIQRQDTNHFLISESQNHQYQDTPSQVPIQNPLVYPQTQPALSPSTTSYYHSSQDSTGVPQQQAQYVPDHMHTSQQPSTDSYHHGASSQQQYSPQQVHQPISATGSVPPQQIHQPTSTTENVPPPQQQQGYWQPQPQLESLPQSRVPYPSINEYSQDSFPSAPSHQPHPKVVEESLIEL